MPSAASRSHWFSTEWRGRSARGRATRRVYIQLRPAIVVADPERRAAQPRQQRAARAAVKVDGEIVAGRAQPPREREVAREPGRAAASARRTMTSSMSGCRATTGAAAGSTT